VLINNAGVGSKSEINENAVILGVKNAIGKNFHGIWKMAKNIAPVIKKTGMIQPGRSASDIQLDRVKYIMETNFYGAWRMIQVFLPLLLKSEDARIINISSGSGALTNLTGEYPGYSLSKASLNSLTIMFANELRDKGIRVNAVCPGWVKTDMGGPDAPLQVSQGADTAVWLATEMNIPTGKFLRDRIEINW
jgi:NAD(P)-dependent dehydrogenase (short-subunit alcohol dehydrogenase family)